MKPEIKTIYGRILKLTLAASVALGSLVWLIWDPVSSLALLLGILLSSGGFLATLLVNAHALSQGESIVPPLALQIGKVFLTALTAYLLVSQRVDLGLFFFAGFVLILVGITIDQVRHG